MTQAGAYDGRLPVASAGLGHAGVPYALTLTVNGNEAPLISTELEPELTEGLLKIVPQGSVADLPKLLHQADVLLAMDGVDLKALLS